MMTSIIGVNTVAIGIIISNESWWPINIQWRIDDSSIIIIVEILLIQWRVIVMCVIDGEIPWYWYLADNVLTVLWWCYYC